MAEAVFSRQRRSEPFSQGLRTRSGAFFLWGAGGLVAAALLLPPVYLFVRAAGDGRSALAALLRAGTLATLGRTVWLAIVVTTASAAIAVPLAWLTARTDLPGRRLWSVLTPLPLVIPSYVGAYLSISALGPRGLLQQALEARFGVDRLPSIFGFPGAAITLTLLSYPYILLSVRAAFARMDPAWEEASRSLGHGVWETFRRVTLPHLRPALGVGSLLVALYTLRDFGAVSLMRYNTFTRVIFVQYGSFDRAGAAALALLLVALTFAVLVLEARTRGRARYSRAGVGTARRPVTVRLGRWRWPAAVFCAVVVVFSLALPAGVLLLWLVRGISTGEAVAPSLRAAWNSVAGSALAAAITVLAAVPIAVLAVRRGGRASRALERLTFSAFALPGIVVALALVFFGANFALPLYQTLPMLVLAYMILFLPQAFGSVRTSLLQVHPSLEETARSLGRTPLQVLRDITLPLVRPGLAAGAALVFLTTMKELPATLLLAPLGFDTLATEVWSAVSEAFFARAAVPALLIMVASAAPMAFLILREERTR